MEEEISALTKTMQAVLEKTNTVQPNTDPAISCLTIENLSDKFEITLSCSTMEEFKNFEKLLNDNLELFNNAVTIF